MYGTAGVNVCAVVDIEPIMSGAGATKGNACEYTRWATPSVRATRAASTVAIVHRLPCLMASRSKSQRMRCQLVRPQLNFSRFDPVASRRRSRLGSTSSARDIHCADGRLVRRVTGDVGNTEVMSTSEREC